MTYSALDAGDCLGSSGIKFGRRTSWPRRFRVVPCNYVHIAEVFGAGSYAKRDAFPGANTVNSQSYTFCRRQLSSYDKIRPPYLITELPS